MNMIQFNIQGLQLSTHCHVRMLKEIRQIPIVEIARHLLASLLLSEIEFNGDKVLLQFYIFKAVSHKFFLRSNIQ